MSNSGHMRPPFIGAPVPNMTTATPQPVQVQHQQQPTSPFNLNVPPPNFSIPPPNSTSPFPRFSGPMHNQPTFYPGNTNTAAVSVPLPHPHIPSMNQPMPHLPAVYNTFNTSGVAANLNQGSVPKFNHGTVAGHWSSCMTGNSNVQRHPYPNHHNQHQRQLPNLSNDIFSDAPKEPTGSFPHFKPPTMPPPSGTVAALQNSISPSSPQTVMQMQQQQGRGGMNNNNNRGGGYRQGNNNFGNFNNSNMDRGNLNRNYNNSNNNNNNSNYNNNKRGRGGFFNNRGKGGNFHHNSNNNNNNSNNNKGRGGNKNQNGHHGGVDNKNEPKAPEDYAFFCDTCDRGFKTEEKYLEHVSQHEKCRYADCPFVAAPKLVQLHMNMQHRRGLASQIYGMKSEEDIKKWKEERRKHYPTAENIKKKKERQEERIARGEVIETKEFGKMRGQNQERGSGRGRGRFGRERRGGGYRNSRGRDEEVVNLDNGDDNDDDDAPPEERKIERSSKEDKKEPSLDLTIGTDSDDQDSCPSKKSKNSKDGDNVVVDLTGESTSSSSSPGKKKKRKEQKKTACGDQEDDKDNNREDTSLSLLSGYGSDDSDGNSPSNKGAKGESGGHKDTTDKSTKANTTATPDCNEGSKPLVNGHDKTVDRLDNNKTVPTTTTTTKEVSSNRISEVKSSKRGHHAANGGPADKRPKYTPRPLPKSHTLLEKMLANEIRRERNKILQCVHFIVKNKFFDKNDGDSS